MPLVHQIPYRGDNQRATPTAGHQLDRNLGLASTRRHDHDPSTSLLPRVDGLLLLGPQRWDLNLRPIHRLPLGNSIDRSIIPGRQDITYESVIARIGAPSPNPRIPDPNPLPENPLNGGLGPCIEEQRARIVVEICEPSIAAFRHSVYIAVRHPGNFNAIRR